MKTRIPAVVVLVAAFAFAPGATDSADAHPASTYFTHTWDTDYEECHFLFVFNCHTHNRDINVKAIGLWTSEALNSFGEAAWQVGYDVPSVQYLNFNWQGLTADARTTCDSFNYNNNTSEWYNNGTTYWAGSVQVCYNGATTLRSFWVFSNAAVYDDFYFGNSGDTPSFGYKSTAMHELVHGLGFGIGVPEANKHFPEADEILCVDAFDAAGNSRHVMCPAAYEGNDIYSLREHDWVTTADAYGGTVA